MNSKPSAFDSGPPRSEERAALAPAPTPYAIDRETPRAVAEALRRLGGVKETGKPDQWDAYCPTGKHEKRHLRITVGEGGIPRFHCHAGCDWKEIHPALLGLGVSAEDLGSASAVTASASAPRQRQQRPAPGPVPMVPWEWVVGWHETLLGNAERMEWLLTSRGLTADSVAQGTIGWYGKRYTIPIYDEDDRCVNVRRYAPDADPNVTAKMINLKGYGENRLYVPNGVVDPARRVVLCAGEWDALLAWQHGLNAVTFTGGEGSVPASEHLEVLRDLDVVVVYDCDDAGRKGAVKAAVALTQLGCSVAVADLALGQGEDVSDWFVKHKRTVEELRAVLNAAIPWEDGARSRELQRLVDSMKMQRDARRVVDAEEADARFRTFPRQTLAEALDQPRPEEPPTLVERLHRVGYNTTISAKYKTGKTTLGGNLLRSLADGSPFLDRFSVQQPDGRIGLLNFELTDGDMLDWLDDQDMTNPDRVAVLNLRGVPFSLASPKYQQELIDWCREMDVKVLHLDPHRRAFTGFGSENSNDDVNRFTETLDTVKEQADVTDLFLYVHMGRVGTENGDEHARGATALDDWADQRWVLTKDDDGDRFLYADGRLPYTREMKLRYDLDSRRLTAEDGNRRDSQNDRLTKQILNTLAAAGEKGALTGELEKTLSVNKNGALVTPLRKLQGSGQVHLEEKGRAKRWRLPEFAPKDGA